MGDQRMRVRIYRCRNFRGVRLTARYEWCASQGDAWYPFYIGDSWQGAMDAAWRRIRRDAA